MAKIISIPNPQDKYLWGFIEPNITKYMKLDKLTIKEKEELIMDKAQLQSELSLVKQIVSSGDYSVVLVKSDRNGEVPLNFTACHNSTNDGYHRNLASIAAMTIKASIEARLQFLKSLDV